MNTVISIAHTLLRITAVVQIVLGLLFWTGNAYSLIPVHMLSGLILVLCLLVLAILGALAGVGRGLAVLAIVWSFVVPIFGVTQSQLLPGPTHWIVEVLHLLVGLAAIGMGEQLARRLKARRQPAPAS